ncbi:hypothetical protein N9J52_03725 [Flavobacteriales bacterium]|nr:hypothetical protein [Flavobacteriales bacterium]
MRFAVILYAAVSLNAAALPAQDSTFVKMAYGGSYITVPEGENWGIERVFITGNDGYSIQVSNNNFQSYYSSSDTIRVPHYIAEMEMLSGGDMPQFKFYVKLLKNQD